jgi:Ca-activated chloride channel family protein
MLGAKEATDIALEYNLITKDTSYVLVYERDEGEKSDEVPAVRKVPQVFAAGWGGLGTIRPHMDMALEACSSMLARKASRLIDASAIEDIENLDISAFLRRQPDSFEPLVSALNSRYPDSTGSRLDIQTISELVALGLDEEVGEELLELRTSSVTERHVTVAFLTAMSGSEHGEGLSRHVKRLIRMAGKEVPVSASLVSSINQILRN